MAFVVADRVKETTTTTGTGTYTLAGAVDGYRSFAAIGNSNTTFYVVAFANAADGVDWEAGIGTYTSSGTTLARTTVLASSNSGSAVDWPAGEKEVFVDDSGARALWNLAAGLIKTNAAGQLSAVTITTAGENLLDDADAAAQRTTLGLGTAAEANTGTSDGNVPVYASGAINMADKVLQRPKLLDVGETKQTVAAASTTDIDLEFGNVCELTQNTNITTFTFSKPPASGTFGSLTIIRVKDASGTTRSIVWPTSVDWPGGTAPTLTQTTGAVDIFVFFTIDGGTRWHGAMASGDSK